WASVGAPSGAGPYTYTATYKDGANSATYTAGTTVVNYGPADQGFLYMTADDADGPFYSVRMHAGAPWNDQTEVARLGNLKNSYGVGDESRYGFGVGDYSEENYLAYDTANGF